MMSIADRARDNAIAIELKKDGLSQKQNGDWVVRFTVQAADMDSRLVKAAMGQRFVAALVEVGDNEQPKEVTPDPKKSPITPRPRQEPTGGAKGSWRDLLPSAQAAIRCDEPIFRAFLNERCQYRTTNKDDAAEAVREICVVKSRKELNTNHAARGIWHALDEQFLTWKALEHA